MSGIRAETEALIADLSAGLQPVRRLPRPVARATAWLGCVGLVATVCAARADLPAIGARIESFADMWLAVAGSVATMVTASIGAVMLSLPDRSSRWALLPLPAAAFWLVASGMGCLRHAAIPDLRAATMAVAMDNCVPFILKMSVVLAVPLAVLLWRARPLRPGLVAGVGGLAVASGSASLLWFFHPYDASAADLVLHAAAVILVVLALRAIATVSDRWIGPHRRR